MPRAQGQGGGRLGSVRRVEIPLDVDPPPADHHLVDDLKAVHAHLRRCHDACLEVALAAPKNLAARHRLRRLGSYYVEFVHAHHTGEEAELFPALRRDEEGDLDEIVDQLEADHRTVAERLRAVATALEAIDDFAPPETVDAATAALQALGDALFTHLAFEEESISPTLRRWVHWPH